MKTEQEMIEEKLLREKHEFAVTLSELTGLCFFVREGDIVVRDPEDLIEQLTPETIEERIEIACRQDLKEHQGKIIEASLVMGYHNYNQIEVACDPPARVRVTQKDDGQYVNWTTTEFADPNWDVELVEPHPSLEGVHSLYIDGISRSTTGQVQCPSTWKVVNSSKERQDEQKA